jgi:uncharacterized protein DUF3105
MGSTPSLSRGWTGPRKRRGSALLAALAVLAVAGCGKGEVTPAGTSGCTPVRSPKIIGATHIPEGSSAEYNSTPPTSGNHYPRPAQAGVYTEPIPNERQVHNLEHGHVMVQYRDLTQDQILALEAIVQADPKMVVLAPYPDMQPRLALTAWGKIQTCDVWSDDALLVVKQFISKYRDHGPESIP